MTLNVIPPILAAENLSEGIEFAAQHPHARWYVEKRAKALGGNTPSWSSPVVAAAEYIVNRLISGTISSPEGRDLRALVAAARIDSLLTHPAVVAAVNWREWLHPRGKDGQFIEKFSFVNVYGDGNDPLNSPNASRRRAQIRNLSPKGAQVQYYDVKGRPVAPDPSNGFPETITGEEFTAKVAKSPRSVARLDGAPETGTTDIPKQLSPPAQALHESAEFEKWQNQTQKFNSNLSPERSANTSEQSDPLPDAPSYKDMGFSKTTSAEEAFQGLRDRQSPEFTRHQQYVAETVRNADAAGLGIGVALTGPKKKDGGEGDRVWTEAAQAYMESLVDEAIADFERRGVPKGHHALMMGGLPGAGKTTLAEKYGLHMDRWAISDPDIIKDRMVRDGIFPPIEGLSPMETAGLMHEMSAVVSKALTNRLLAEGFNTVADISMGGRARPGKKTYAEQDAIDFKKAGYNLDAVFVEIPIAMSAASQNQRHLSGVNRLRSQQSTNHEGGRYVPEFVLRAAEGDDPNVTQNRANFNRMKDSGLFDRWYVVDNTNYDTTPTLIGRGAEAGRKPKYKKSTDDRGFVTIGLEEPTDDLPGMYAPTVGEGTP